MKDAIITELDSNLSFNVEIDNPPEVKQNFSTLYVDDKEVKSSTFAESNGEIVIKLKDAIDQISNYITNWNSSKKRIDLMIETNQHMYLVKGCYIKRFEGLEKAAFTVFYNTFKES